MSVSNALKLSCLGITGGLMLRLVTMLFFYDYDTGFFKDDGMLAWITIAFIAVVWIFALICCVKDKYYFFGGYEVRKNIFAGLIALLSAGALATMVFVQLKNHKNFPSQESSATLSQGNTIHTIFIVISALMVLLQLDISISFFSGTNFFSAIPAVHLISVLWGIINVLFTFLYYAKSALTTENIYMIFGNVSLLFALLNISKLIVGLGNSGTAKRLYIVGIPAVIINITYNLSNLVLNLLGKNYIALGEIPFVIQSANLCVSLYVLAFLFTFKKYSLKRKSRAAVEEEKQKRKNRYNEA